MKWLEEISRFIRELLPTIASFVLGKKIGEMGKDELQAKKDALVLEIERFRIAERIRKENDGRSDGDIIDGAIKRGAEMLGRKPTEGDG